MLTPKQKAILEFISNYNQKHGYSPTQREIADFFGFKSLGTIQNYLVRLERHGHLQRNWNERRSSQITSKRGGPVLNTTTTHTLVPPPFSLPLLGRVAAGKPIEYAEEGEIEIPPTLVPLHSRDQCFVLKVQGDSMTGDGILDGDYVIIKKQNQANPGETVVALIGNEATIKRFYRKKSHVELHAANPVYEPILIDSLTESQAGFKIEGILIGVIRKYTTHSI